MCDCTFKSGHLDHRCADMEALRDRLALAYAKQAATVAALPGVPSDHPVLMEGRQQIYAVLDLYEAHVIAAGVAAIRCVVQPP